MTWGRYNVSASRSIPIKCHWNPRYITSIPPVLLGKQGVNNHHVPNNHIEIPIFRTSLTPHLSKTLWKPAGLAFAFGANGPRTVVPVWLCTETFSGWNMLDLPEMTIQTSILYNKKSGNLYKIQQHYNIYNLLINPLVSIWPGSLHILEVFLSSFPSTASFASGQ